jgi:phosphate-selective porin OprO/OprP
VARVSSLDLTDEGVVGGEQDDFTVGVNWYPNPATRLMINYVNADVDFPLEEPAGTIDSASADFILVRWQVDF